MTAGYTKLICFIIAAALLVPGCAGGKRASESPPAQVEKAASNVPSDSEVGQYCRVCFLDGGNKGGEYLPPHLAVKHGGREYGMCSEQCRDKFKQNPSKYALKPE